jgi:Domain of unknown function (DUF4158)
MKRQWETEELIEHWTLNVEELALPGNKTGATRLGLTVLLKFFQKEARFPTSKLAIPPDRFAGIARKVLAVYRNRAGIEKPGRLRAHAEPMRLTLLAALSTLRGQEITDALVELLLLGDARDQKRNEV